MRGGREPWPLTSSVTLGVFLTSLGSGAFFSYGYRFFFFGCAGSLLLCRLFSSCGEWGLLFGCEGFSLQWLIFLQSTLSRVQGL